MECPELAPIVMPETLRIAKLLPDAFDPRKVDEIKRKATFLQTEK